MNVQIAAARDIVKISYVLTASWKTAYRGIIDDDYLKSISYDHWVDYLTTGLIRDTIFLMVLLDKQEIVGASILGKTEKTNVINRDIL